MRAGWQGKKAKAECKHRGGTQAAGRRQGSHGLRRAGVQGVLYERVRMRVHACFCGVSMSRTRPCLTLLAANQQSVDWWRASAAAVAAALAPRTTLAAAWAANTPAADSQAAGTPRAARRQAGQEYHGGKVRGYF